MFGQTGEPEMRIIIYNPNSFGGNHEYAKALCIAYRNNKAVTSTALLMPANSPAVDEDISHMLLDDIGPYRNKWLKKIYFVYRSFINPLRLYRFLKKSDNSFVIFNDFDQLTSFYWTGLFRSLKKKHFFGVVLHDPDRDKYLPVKWMSSSSMRKLMKLMDIAFYHGYLPQKPYYENGCKKVEVPHGIFSPVTPNAAFTQSLQSKKKRPYLLGMLGNIREEKNYELVLEAMRELPDCQLLVTGAKANSNVPVQRYRQKITDLKLEEQVIWIERFLEEDELHAAISECDVIIMYYSPSFQSQSGILNTIAPYRKKLLVSDTPSALQKTIVSHNLALLVPPENKEEFVKNLKLLVTMDPAAFNKGWKTYAEAASWERHVNIAITNFRQMAATL